MSAPVCARATTVRFSSTSSARMRVVPASIASTYSDIGKEHAGVHHAGRVERCLDTRERREPGLTYIEVQKTRAHATNSMMVRNAAAACRGCFDDGLPAAFVAIGHRLGRGGPRRKRKIEIQTRPVDMRTMRRSID